VLPQSLQVGDDIGDLLIGEPAQRSLDRCSGFRNELTQAERRSSVINEDATERLNHLNKNHSAALQLFGDRSVTVSPHLQGHALNLPA